MLIIKIQALVLFEVLFSPKILNGIRTYVVFKQKQWKQLNVITENVII